MNAGDFERYASLFTDDIVWLPPGQPAVAGRDAMKKWLEPFFEQFLYKFSIAGPKVRIAGDWAVERGRFTSKLTPREGGKSMKHTGTYILLWRRDSDGTWRMERYVDDTEIG